MEYFQGIAKVNSGRIRTGSSSSDCPSSSRVLSFDERFSIQKRSENRRSVDSFSETLTHR
ncbi:MAG: hypothetical protein DWH94_05565 [Planctomycetota bacterium]|nr:MAG: hypothetical protein DWH80_01665 [Planctomycetota bacterium]RLS58407.1 MAG: hypothetical protein DWH94_05565 [Planctomycetota bacterium]